VLLFACPSDTNSTLERLNRQFMLSETEREAVAWGWCFDVGNTMFHVIQAYTKGAQFDELSAESSHKLQRTGGNILAMVN